MQNSKTYDTTGNYVISETNQAGGTVEYTYDVNGNVTLTTDGEKMLGIIHMTLRVIFLR